MVSRDFTSLMIIIDCEMVCQFVFCLLYLVQVDTHLSKPFFISDHNLFGNWQILFEQIRKITFSEWNTLFPMNSLFLAQTRHVLLTFSLTVQIQDCTSTTQSRLFSWILRIFITSTWILLMHYAIFHKIYSIKIIIH